MSGFKRRHPKKTGAKKASTKQARPVKKPTISKPAVRRPAGSKFGTTSSPQESHVQISPEEMRKINPGSYLDHLNSEYLA